MHLDHLVVDLLGGHGATVHHGAGEVAAVARVGSAHHVLGIKGLGGELGYAEEAVVLRAAGGEGGESNEEEVEAGEGDHIDRELAEIAVELSREAEGAGGSSDGGGDEVVEVTIGRVGELERAHADVVQGLVVEREALVRVLNELVDGEGCVVRLDDSVGDLGGGHDRVGGHDAVGELLADLGDEEGAHAGAGAASHRVGDLEALEHVAVLGLLADNVHDAVNELGALGVVALGPVVSGSGLAEDEVVGAEELADGGGADGVHCAGLEVGQNGAGDVAAALGLAIVDVDAGELKVVVSLIGALAVDAVLGRHALRRAQERVRERGGGSGSKERWDGVSGAPNEEGGREGADEKERERA